MDGTTMNGTTEIVERENLRDPLAEQTEWAPVTFSTALIGNLTMRHVGGRRIEVAPSRAVFPIAVFIVLLGVAMVALTVLAFANPELVRRWDHRNSPSIIMGLFGVGIAAIGVLLAKASRKGRIIDPGAGEAPPFASSEGLRPFHFDEVRAIQWLSVREPPAHVLLVILEDGSRRQIIQERSSDRARAYVEMLAETFHVPVWHADIDAPVAQPSR